MNTFKIAFNNFKHNIKTYGINLFAFIFSVAVFYNFMAIQSNPQVSGLKQVGPYIESCAASVAFVLLVFLIFFIWYSNSFFINQRKKEIGIYSLLGVPNNKIASIFSLEVIFLGLTSLVVGLLIGILFNKLFTMLLVKVALLNITVEFYISINGIFVTSIVFIIILLLSSIKNFINISRSQLVDLFNALKKDESLPKTRPIKAIASLLILGGGYFLSTKMLELEFFTSMNLTVILVVWGTYWFMGSFFPLILKKIVNNKSVLYKGANIVSLTNIVYRIKYNYKMISTIAVLIAVTLTAVGTVTSLKYYLDEGIKLNGPYDITYVTTDKAEVDKINNIIKDNNYSIDLNQTLDYVYIKGEDENWKDNIIEGHFTAIKYSDFKRVTKDLAVWNAEDVINKAKPHDNGFVYIKSPEEILSMFHYNKIIINGNEYKINEIIKTPLYGLGFKEDCVVVDDNLYEELKKNSYNGQFHGININANDIFKDIEIINKIQKAIPENINFYSYKSEEVSKIYYIGVIYFLGAFLGLVFSFATGSIIYFKLLCEAVNDKEKYMILNKIGMNKSELIKIVSKQVRLMFILPLLIGIVHTMFALRVLSLMLSCNLFIPTLTSIILFAIIYGFFYILTTHNFVKLVTKQ